MTMRVALVGYGYWGTNHARVLRAREDVELTIVDASPARLAAAVAAHPGVATATDLGEVLAMVDAVVVATPPRSHAPVARAALLAGCHVLAEKPLALTSPECEDLIQLADERDRVLMVGHTFEHNAAVWKLREVIRSGELGEILYIDTARLNLGLYQGDVNVLWDLAPHDFSIVNFLLDATPVALSAWGARHAQTNFEDVAHVHLTYAEPNVEAYLHVSWLDPCKVRRVTVVGSRKMAVYNDMALAERIKIYDTGVEFGAPGSAMVPEYRNGAATVPLFDWHEPLAEEDRHFLECITSGTRPTTDGHSGLEVVRLLEASDVALREQRTVSLARIASTKRAA
jgi:predicted dehydrogenase